MSTNAIKLLNIQYTMRHHSEYFSLKWSTRNDVLRHLAAKIIGAGC